MLGNLTDEEEALYQELHERLLEDPPIECAAHAKEGHKRRLLRFLRADKFDVEKAHKRIHDHALWWREYGMDDFKPEDEFDEQGIAFVCGADVSGHPTLIARPAVHTATTHAESIQAARRCVYTMQRCLERLEPGKEKVSLVYDVHGLELHEVDLSFTRELMSVFERQFPERMGLIIVINNGFVTGLLWTIVQPFMDPVTRQKIKFLGESFEEELMSILGPHPYLSYALKVRGMSKLEAANVPLPPSDPYVPRWQDAVLADQRNPLADGSLADRPTGFSWRFGWTRQASAEDQGLSSTKNDEKTRRTDVKADVQSSLGLSGDIKTCGGEQHESRGRSRLLVALSQSTSCCSAPLDQMKARLRASRLAWQKQPASSDSAGDSDQASSSEGDAKRSSGEPSDPPTGVPPSTRPSGSWIMGPMESISFWPTDVIYGAVRLVAAVPVTLVMYPLSKVTQTGGEELRLLVQTDGSWFGLLRALALPLRFPWPRDMAATLRTAAVASQQATSDPEPEEQPSDLCQKELVGA